MNVNIIGKPTIKATQVIPSYSGYMIISVEGERRIVTLVNKEDLIDINEEQILSTEEIVEVREKTR